MFNPEAPDPPFGDWPVFNAPPSDELPNLVWFGVGCALFAVCLCLIGFATWAAVQLIDLP